MSHTFNQLTCVLFLSIFYSVLPIEGKMNDWCGVEIPNTPDVQFEENALHDAIPKENANVIAFLENVPSFQHCVQKCCSHKKCNVAFLLRYSCILISCNNSFDNSCQPSRQIDETIFDISYWLMVRNVDHPALKLKKCDGDDGCDSSRETCLLSVLKSHEGVCTCLDGFHRSTVTHECESDIAYPSSLETRIFASTVKPVSETLSTSIDQNTNGVVTNAGGNQSINMPVSVVVLNGTRLKDRSGEIVKYIWKKDPSSPAAGEILFDSDKSPCLHLTNLVPGIYNFLLQVISSRNISSQDQITLTINPDPFLLNLVNMHLKANLSDFRESHLITLQTQVTLILRVVTPLADIINVNIRKVLEDPSSHQVIIQFYIEQISNKGVSNVWPAVKVVDVLEERLRYDTALQNFKIRKLETTVCQDDCSGHGFCDQLTRSCICNSFWIKNFFSRRSNCDWNVFNVGLFSTTLVVFLSVLACIIFCTCKKKCCNKLKNSYKPFSKMSRKNRAKTEFLFKDQSIGLMDNLMDESDDEEEETHFQGKSISKVHMNNLAKKKINA